MKLRDRMMLIIFVKLDVNDERRRKSVKRKKGDKSKEK